MALHLTAHDLLHLCGFPAADAPKPIPSMDEVPVGGCCPTCWGDGEVLLWGERIVLAYCQWCGVQWFPGEIARAVNIRFRHYRMVDALAPSPDVN